jgi:arylformamidase
MKFIDLSLTLKQGMQYYKSGLHPQVEIIQIGNMKQHKRETRKITLGTHSGTHIDAPKHFLGGNRSVEKIKLNKLVGKAQVLNFSKAKNKSKICVDDVKKQLSSKKLPKKLLFRFDWTDKYYGTKNYYKNHPYLSDKLCRWIVKKKIDLIGLDTPQPDNPNDTNTLRDGINHKILLKKKVVIVEYLINLKKIKKKYVNFYCCPIKIKDGDGAPSRCFVIE